MQDSSQFEPEPIAPVHTPEDDGVDLVELSVRLLGQWPLFFIAFILFGVMGVAYVYSLKPQYVAKASIIPAEAHSETDTLASLFGTRGPGALYIGLLRSRSVQDAVIKRVHLRESLHTNSMELARAALTGKSEFVEGGDSIIIISIRDSNAESATQIANAYLECLQELSDRMTNAASVITRNFFERQLEQEQKALASAETELEHAQQHTGLVSPQAQQQIGISTIGSLRSEITSLQVQLASLRQGATEENPQVQRLVAQIARLQAQENEQETGRATPIGAAPSAASMPSANLAMEAAQRNVRNHEQLVSALASQYETARLNQGFSRAAFEVVDQAVPPEVKAWPPRKLYVIVSLVAAAFFAFVVVILRLLALRINENPVHRASLRRLRGAF